MDSYTPAALEQIISLTAYFDYLLRSVKAELQGVLVSLYLYGCIIKKGKLNREGIDFFQ